MTTPAFIDKLQKVLALTKSPNEFEAQAAADILAKLLKAHNLDMADLEARGTEAAPGVEERGHDLGKAAFQWKLDLARYIANFYYCEAIVFADKSLVFIGRPDNVQSLQMLYGWLIDQIKRIATEERKVWMLERRTRGPAPLASQLRHWCRPTGP